MAAAGREDQEEAAVPQTEGVPCVAHQAEGERKVHGNGGNQPESGDLLRRCAQLVLQHVRSLDVDEVPGRRCQIEKKGQRTEIEEGLAGVCRTIFAGGDGGNGIHR